MGKSEIPSAKGVLKVKFLEAKYEAKLEFPGELGVAKQKTFHGGGGGGMDIFWNFARGFAILIAASYLLLDSLEGGFLSAVALSFGWSFFLP